MTPLTRWRDVFCSSLSIAFMATPLLSSEPPKTAPYDFPKSALIFADACKVLEKERLEASWNGAVNGLALLATGNAGYLPKVKELIAALNEQCPRDEFPKGELNNRRVSAAEEAIKSIEAATTQPELRRIAPVTTP